MPVAPGEGVDASLPGGALRLDVNPSELNSGVSVGSNGVFVQPQYGAEAIMKAVNFRGFPYATLLNGFNNGFNAITPCETILDYSELSAAPQVEATSGTFTAQVDGVYEIGGIVSVSPQAVLAAMHLEFAIWTDYGYPGLTINAFAGTQNQPYGTYWQRIGVTTIGLSAATAAGASTIADAPGIPIKHSTVWCVKNPGPVGIGIGSQYKYTSAAPTRFRFSVRTEAAIAGDVYVNGSLPFQSRFWMRWLGGV